MRNSTRLSLAALTVLGFAGVSSLASSHAAPHDHPPEPAKPAAKVAENPKAEPGKSTDATRPAGQVVAASHAAGVPADEAVRKLAEGNDRFVAGAAKHPNQDQARLCDTFANGQHPFAAVLSCADSRVPPELLFDAGIGDLFVVRVAGNVANVDEIGTLEYGVEHLGVNAILVMGHGKCGAVTAVVDHAAVTPSVARLVEHIGPAADDARKAFPQLTGPRLVEKAIKANVRRSIADVLAGSELIRERVKAGSVKIVGGVYNLHTGEVDWLEASSSPMVATPAGEILKTAAPAEKAPAGHEPASHGAHSAGHAAPAGAAHAAAATTQPVPGKDAAPKSDNFLALGGLVGGGAAVSYGIIRFVSSRAA